MQASQDLSELWTLVILLLPLIGVCLDAIKIEENGLKLRPVVLLKVIEAVVGGQEQVVWRIFSNLTSDLLPEILTRDETRLS